MYTEVACLSPPCHVESVPSTVIWLTPPRNNPSASRISKKKISTPTKTLLIRTNIESEDDDGSKEVSLMTSNSDKEEDFVLTNKVCNAIQRRSIWNPSHFEIRRVQ